MNPLSVLQDSLYFFRSHLLSIAKLCLPLVVLETLLGHVLYVQLGEQPSTLAYSVLLGLIFYPLYSGALILYMDARSQGEEPRKRDLLATSLRLWPSFALLVIICMLMIMAGISLLVLPGIWVMVNLVFAEYLLVLRGLQPLAAIRQSFVLCKGHFWQILVCIIGVMLPLWLISALLQSLLGENPTALLSVLVDCLNGFLTLFSTLVSFRLFMLVTDPALQRAER
ncbi:hypothetical protein [Pseudomonas aegrilactucae]|uniref:Glycerophosphoryl diester phosphodiesterase membrane domain-containing protein n=1 Tax=Pseudomonas aegrilactucae TaxID=2854028 RepID=A0A9Q2XKM3_9PSED|nr:hypothetical protein [Pseudomonas aegrilactucae]MBV6288653.1 hypothetical protein [Pseudomonas aegrilactucae]